MVYFHDRYSSAVHSGNLKSDPKTVWSDTDTLSAAGIASKFEPLGIALARMLSGGGSMAVVDVMARLVFEKSYRIRKRITERHARDLAIAVLAWFRHGTCQHCGGTGYKKIKDTPVNGKECSRCRGAGKIVFDAQFDPSELDLAKWLASEIERSQAAAGDLAMRKISRMMDF